MEEYQRLNRAMWDSRAARHAASTSYDLDRYRRDPHAISDVVRFDQPRLGDITGLDVVHLQCHIGTDTLSLHRLGGRVTGLDLSPASLDEARHLAADVGAEITYVESDVHAAPDVLGRGAFDVVYTGIGAVCWLPSIDRWAATVAALLRPGGRLVFRDCHPMLGTLEVVDGRIEMVYPYAEHVRPLVFTDTASYVDPDDHSLPGLPSHEWSHGLAEILTALLAHGMTLETVLEHDSVPWVPLPGFMSPHPDLPGEHRLTDRPERLAASFTIVAMLSR
ncbi:MULTISPECIES: class I SAM-dependent methyltransferase [unclassified Aeromicrobium]|uniref:class I SAM-dependent methyltransferase n=1 Tax=unclassified Aeromicrobium TaxID=2633570 RepID=UPI000A6D89EC|nr:MULTISPECIES: class I SAM-dependent methyltransferase [unclassified Aeromicrobium]